jgi:hypothetical protein
MHTLSRRTFHQQTLGSLLTWSLLDMLSAADAFADEVKPITVRWLSQLDEWSRDLKGKKLEQLAWQTKVEELFAKVDLPELLQFIDFEKLKQQVQQRPQGEQSLRPKLPQVEGLPTDLVFGYQVFALSKGRSVAPHGHDNMATAFLILKGDFHGRHYDRLEDDREHMIITPTIDRPFGPGGCSTVTDIKDNVHWFEATCDDAFIFNIHVMNVMPGRTGRVYIDPNGEKLSGNRIKARKIGHEEAYKLYG